MDKVTPNQRILSRIQAQHALGRAIRGPAPDPHMLLMEAVHEALASARARSAALCAAGGAGTAEHVELIGQIAKWDRAWRANR